ncbi:putative flippase GtrA [Sphingobium xanthum]|jgi:putative flippase GtrA|uniref:GtrA family protein n=1 Tax=Sphingobium xanthum TaxID=1387165 RepID=UPI001FEBB148|nr:GtrA family protein [Sphingobium xanthum]
MIASLWSAGMELLRQRYVRYGIASAVALGSDMGLFLLFMSAGLDPAPASALGYSVGILVHWLISSRLVFAEGAAPKGPERTRQKALFVGSAIIGLAITTGIVALGSFLGLVPVASKLIAIAVSFQTTYILRKTIVFATSP